MERNTIKKAIEILQNGNNLVHESLIEDFVWANTAKPKYKIGDAVRFSYSDMGILRYKTDKDGRRIEERKTVHWAIGKVTEVRRVMRSHTFQYTVEFETDLGDGAVSGRTVTKHEAYPMEDRVRPVDVYRPTLWEELDGRK